MRILGNLEQCLIACVGRSSNVWGEVIGVYVVDAHAIYGLNRSDFVVG